MNVFLQRVAEPVRRAPWVVVIVAVLLTVVFGAVAGTGTSDQGDFEDFATSTPAAAAADEIAARFATDDTRELIQLAVVDEDGDVLAPDALVEVQQVIAELTADPAVQAVAAPSEPGGPIVTSYAGPVLGAVAQQGLDLAELDDDTVDQLYQRAVAQLPDAVRGQLSVLLGGEVDGADATAGMLLVFLDGSAEAEQLAAARAAITSQAGPRADGLDVHHFDFETLNDDANAAVEQELGTLLVVAFLMIVLILAAVYRSASDVVASLVGLVMAIVWMQGIGVLLGPDYLGWTGGMSQMAQAIPILLVGLGVDYGIHLTMRAREEQAAGVDAGAAAGAAIHAVGAALALATMTTVVGFMTNLANPLPPLQDFGVLAAVGVIAAFLVMTTFVPAVRLLVAGWHRRRGRRPVGVPSDPEHVGTLGRLSSAFAPFAVHHPGRVLVVAAVVTVLAGGGVTQLSTEFSQTDFFPQGSRALETVEVVTRSFGGGLDERTDVLVTGDVAAAAGLSALAEYQDGLAQVDEVRTFEGAAQVDSVVTRLAGAGLLADALASDASTIAAIDQLRASDPTLSGLLTPEGDAAVVRISTSAGEDARALQERLGDLAAATLVPAGLDAQATSDQLVIEEILSELQSSQIVGLAITLLASMAILALAFWFRDRAPMLGVLSIASVGVTTVWVLGLMAVAGIPFNVMTAMVSALAIGIGVPFGIHVVNRFEEDRSRFADVAVAMRHTLAHTGGALVGSAVTTVAGFGVLVLSSIVPMRQFGLVTGVTISLALLTSLTVLPALLTYWDRSRRRRDREGGVAPTSPALPSNRVDEPVGTR